MATALVSKGRAAVQAARCREPARVHEPLPGQEGNGSHGEGAWLNCLSWGGRRGYPYLSITER